MNKKFFAVIVFAAVMAIIPGRTSAQYANSYGLDQAVENTNVESQEDSIFIGETAVRSAMSALEAVNDGPFGHRIYGNIDDRGVGGLCDVDGALLVIAVDGGACLSSVTKYEVYGAKVGIDYRVRKFNFRGLVGVERHEYGNLSSPVAQGLWYPSFTLDIEATYRVASWGEWCQNSFNIGLLMNYTTKRMYYTSETLDLGITGSKPEFGGLLSYEWHARLSPVSVEAGVKAMSDREQGPGLNQWGTKIQGFVSFKVKLGKFWKVGSRASYKEAKQRWEDYQSSLANPTKKSSDVESFDF